MLYRLNIIFWAIWLCHFALLLFSASFHSIREFINYISHLCRTQCSFFLLNTQLIPTMLQLGFFIACIATVVAQYRLRIEDEWGHSVVNLLFVILLTKRIFRQELDPFCVLLHPPVLSWRMVVRCAFTNVAIVVYIELMIIMLWIYLCMCVNFWFDTSSLRYIAIVVVATHKSIQAEFTRCVYWSNF